MATPPTKPTWFDFLDAAWIALGLLTAGIGAVEFGVPWDVVVPLALTVATGFIGRLAGKAQAARALTVLKSYNVRLTDDLGRTLTERDKAQADLKEVSTKLEAAAADALSLRAQLRTGGH